MRATSGLLITVALLTSACGADGAPSQAAGPVTTTSAPTPGATVATTISGPADVAVCVLGEPKTGLDMQAERMLRLYNAHNAEALAAIIGDGPVLDPSLEPGGNGRYESVAAWIEAGRAAGDRLDGRGYSFGEPFGLVVVRRNAGLAGQGIESVALVLHIWANQDCEWRVEAGHEISAPEPCRFHQIVAAYALPSGCAGPFEPRALHAAVWTGEEAVVFGGWSGTDAPPPYRSGLAYDPARGSWRELAEAPVGLYPWPELKAVWTGEQMLVVGRDGVGGSPAVLAYEPAADTWVQLPSPPDRMAVGGVVWTGDELILMGGDLHYPDATAWALDPAAGEWRRLPDPGVAPVEGIEGVWTGAEAVFVGGYPDGPGVAFEPAAGTWRELPPSGVGALQQHRLAWTGRDVVVYSGHAGPAHPDRLLLYDPGADAWRRSAPLPIPPAERLAGAWAGDRLLIWGGLATYGPPDGDGDHEYGGGAAYIAATDTWEVLPPAPLSDRCDLSGTWTGAEFVLFGGMTQCGSPGILAEGTAAAYDPVTRVWELLEP